MRATLDIDEDVLRTAEERALATNRFPGQILSDMARRAFELDTVEHLPGKNGFPQLPFDPRIVVTTELVDGSE